MNILFVTSAAPKKSPFFTGEKSPPLGVGSLISISRQAGHKVFFIDNYLKPSDFINQGFLEKNNIDIFGVYANTICFEDSLRMYQEADLRRINNLWSGKIITGGPHISANPKSIPDFVDHIVRGEGEKTLLRILDGEDMPREIVGERIENLDFLPLQPWDIFTKLPYDFSTPWGDEHVFNMNTSRGCPYSCAFCSVGAVWGKKYVAFSADRILEEIIHLIHNFSAKGIYFREDNFTANKKRVLEFCDLLLKQSFNINWYCESRVDSLCDKQLVEQMAKAGCKVVYLGVESGSQNILDLLNKGITVEQIEYAAYLCKSYGIKTYFSMLVGVPGETWDDYKKTKKMVARIKPDSISYNVYVGLQGSRLYDHIIKHKLYEYIDELGLAYLPGFDIRTKYFYNNESSNYVDHEFKSRMNYDEILLKRIRTKKAKMKFRSFLSTIIKFLENNKNKILNR